MLQNVKWDDDVCPNNKIICFRILNQQHIQGAVSHDGPHPKTSPYLTTIISANSSYVILWGYPWREAFIIYKAD